MGEDGANTSSVRTPLDLAEDWECDEECPGDPDQTCGGSRAVTVLTAECEPGWTRLGSKCLYEYDLELEDGGDEIHFQQAASVCSVEMGGNLFWPSSMEELTFVKDSFW